MSTYLQGVTDTGFNPLSYTPNFPYMQQALEKAQAKYDTNYNQIANTYHKIADETLLNPEDNEYKKQFLEKTKDQLKQIATKDFSDMNTVNEAEKIFAPLWEDADLMADYKITKEYQKQVQSYETLKNSDKKEDRDRAWKEGLDYVNLTALEMRNAKRGDGSIQKVQVNPYVENIDISAKLNAELKERGYDKGLVKYKPNGGYMYEITNPEGSSAVYEKVINEIINEHPDWNNIFKVQGVIEFQGNVLKYMNSKPDIDRKTAEKDVKTFYKTQKIKEYTSWIDEYNKVLVDTDKAPGLQSEVTSLQSKMATGISNGTITHESPEYIDYMNKKKHLEDVQQIVGSYNSKINDLNSDDYMASKGDDYFTNAFKSTFIRSYATTRALAYSEKIVIDANYAAARKIESTEKINEAKIESTEEINDKKINAKLVGSKFSQLKTQKTETDKATPLNVNTPIVTSVYKQQEDLTPSYYNNLQSNLTKFTDKTASSAIQFIQSSNSVFNSVPGFNTYMDYLSYYLKGGSPENATFKKEDLEEAFKVLKTQNILPASIQSYNVKPFIQLNEIVKAVEEKEKQASEGGVLSDAQKNYRLDYETNSKKYLANREVIDEFDKEYATSYAKRERETNPALFTKEKDGGFKIITGAGIVAKIKEVDVYPSNDHWYKPNTEPHDKDIKRQKLTSQIASAYLDGTLNVKEVKRNSYSLFNEGQDVGTSSNTHYEYNDNNGNIWDLTPLVKTYGEPETVSKVYNDLITNRSAQIKTFIDKKNNVNSSGESDVVMSNQIMFKNDFKGEENNAISIARDAIDANKQNVLKTGIIKPSNYSALSEDVNSDDLAKALELIFNNESSRLNALQNSKLAFAGRHENLSVVKLEFDAEKLKKELGVTETTNKTLVPVINAILKKGIELEVPTTLYDRYASDEYISSAVSDKMLEKGIESSKWVEDNLHYKYSIRKGSDNTFVVSMYTKEYDPKKTPSFYFTNAVNESFPASIGLDAVMKIVRAAPTENTTYIESIIKQLSKKNEVNKQKPGESEAAWYKRLGL